VDSVRPPRQPYPRAWRATSRDLLHTRLSVHKDPRAALPVTRFSTCYPLARAHFHQTRSPPPWGFRCATGSLLRCCGSALGVRPRGVTNVRRSRPCQQFGSPTSVEAAKGRAGSPNTHCMHTLPVFVVHVSAYFLKCPRV
jgi:hypothetical protein